MDNPLLDGTDILLPPEQVRFRRVNIEPYPDGQRIRVLVEITPFQRRPDIEITVLDAEGDDAGSVSIIEAMEASFSVTIHLRRSAPGGPYVAHLKLTYAEPPVGDETEARFELPAAEGGE